MMCANCGKGEESAGDLKACTACKLVKYCNRDCQIAHRPQHKKACKKRVAELHDKALFKQPPPTEDCPICTLPLPLLPKDSVFQSCCGKIICRGCIHTMIMEEIRRGKKKEEINACAFCRRPAATDEEAIERVKMLMKSDNAHAFYTFAGYYHNGEHDMQQDRVKANELWRKAGELGCAEAYSRLGYSFSNGMGVEVDKKKAKHYYEIAAMKGEVMARYNLAVLEGKAVGNHQRAYKHFIIAARAGHVHPSRMGLRMDTLQKKIMQVHYVYIKSGWMR